MVLLAKVTHVPAAEADTAGCASELIIWQLLQVNWGTTTGGPYPNTATGAARSYIQVGFVHCD